MFGIIVGLEWASQGWGSEEEARMYQPVEKETYGSKASQDRHDWLHLWEKFLIFE